MPLGKPLTPPEISAELRDKAMRLSQETAQTYDHELDGMSGVPPWQLLAIAMFDAMNDRWDAQWRDSPDKYRQAMYHKAVALCRAAHAPTLDEPDRIITGLYGQKPYVSTVPKRRLDPTEPVGEEQVIAISYNLVGMAPLWTHYLLEARHHFDAHGWPDDE